MTKDFVSSVLRKIPENSKEFMSSDIKKVKENYEILKELYEDLLPDLETSAYNTLSVNSACQEIKAMKFSLKDAKEGYNFAYDLYKIENIESILNDLAFLEKYFSSRHKSPNS